MLCSKGMNLAYVVNDTSDRLLYPEMRWSRSHPLQRVSWDRAIQRAAAVFSSLIKNYGPDAVAFYVSGQCLTEEYYIANKLVKGFLGTNNIDTNSRLCMSSAVSGYMQTLGEDIVPASYEDIELADCFLMAGANPAWCHPILFRRIEAHRQKNPGIKIIVVDPRRTQTCTLADLHLPIIPGTDIYLYLAIARVLMENGDMDEAFVRNHTESFNEYREAVLACTVEEAAAHCGIDANDIRLAASYIASSKGFMSLWAMGLNQSVIGVRKNIALISLHLLTGHIGKPGSGPLSLTGQPNAMGGREVGGLATMLSAHRRIDNPQHREEVARFWGVERLSDKPGYTTVQMIEALERGDLKAIWIICTNPMVSWPDARRAEAALAKARFVVVQDISRRADTLAFADLVLPAAGHFEKEGTMTNSERRITHLDKIIEPPGEALPDAEILCRFATAMGFPGFGFSDPGQIFAEYVQLTRGTHIDISGLNYERLKELRSIQWPVPYFGHYGTTRLSEDRRFYTPSGKAKFYFIPPENHSVPADSRYPLILTTGRIRDQWHTMTRTGKVSRLRQHIDKPFLEIHPNDAANRNIGDGDVVVVKNEYGDVRVCARLTTDIRRGVVFLPMHWGKNLSGDAGRANNLTSRLTDPVSGEPDFKFSRVEVEPYAKPIERIIIAGAGTACYRFLCSYRALNMTDRILVISKEPDPFYNRVLLPEYVNLSLPWEKLQKFRNGELEELNVSLSLNNEIVSVNRKEKYIIDRYHQRHDYDKLIIATGSRAHIPKDAPFHLPNVFTLRTRFDADRLRERLWPGGHVLIVGGGLLGVELAVSLRELDVHVSILQMGSRLMERQLDNLAGQLLLDFIEERNITVYMNDQVQHVAGQDTGKLHVLLRSSKRIEADALVYAVGTRPNIEFIQEAGIETARGIIVNDHLQTNDPDIFAIGEVAEHRGKTLGITAAAEKQADVLARFLHGDLHSVYEGTASMNILKLRGFDLCSIGIPEVPSHDPHYEEVLFIDKAQRYYKKCIIKDDRLVGAILIGDKSEFAKFRSLIEDRVELSEQRIRLLRSGQVSEPVLGKLVCSCNQVGAGNLQKLIDEGCNALDEICRRSGAGLGCGSCKPEIRHMLSERSVPVAG